MLNLLKNQIGFLPKYCPKIVFIVSLIISLMLGYWLSSWLCIKNVILVPSNQVRLNTKNLIGQNLWFLNSDKTVAAIQKNHPEIEEITLKKIYPNTIKISYQRARKAAQIKTNAHFLIISSKGIVMRKNSQKEEGLLTIDYYQKIRHFESKPGTSITNQDIIRAIKIVEGGKKLNYSIETATIRKPGRIEVKIKGQPTTILFDRKKNIAKNWIIVHNIIRTLNSKDEEPKEINLLFDKPIYSL
jgi:hypothetical protein